MSEATLGKVADLLDLRPEQQPAWRALGAELRAAEQAWRRACPTLVDEAATAPERLARFESAAAAGLAALRDLRPAFDGFYAALDDGQRRRLDGLFARGRRT